MNRIKNTALLVCGFVAGISLSFLFRKNNKENINPVAVQPGSVKILEEKTIEKEKQLQLLIDQMDRNTALLNDRLQTLARQLHDNRTANRNLLERSMALANKKAPEDTALLLADCDTLKSEVILLNSYIREEESLCDSVTGNQQQQLTQKDSVITLHRIQYASLKNAFTESVAQQKLLLDQNSLFKKQLRKQKLKSKFLSGIAIIAAGITTHYLLK